ncbi:hypothetical protein RvY_14021 [Ramazzottius varieornatus]|uniref:Kinesin-like protein KIF6/9 C-terminal domain-containing protein n=1 Tax=Ramazzottius varieornatus TaxID=947166 RepID=A0A1D1VPY3_RAMVA|nr:hypothetical protein RvY_14021 [Ramazzottius varieornatus]
MEPVDIADSLPGGRDTSHTANEGDDGKASPQSNPFDVEGVGEVDEKEGLAIGSAPSATKWKGVKGLLRKKNEKDEKTVKSEKASVSNAKKAPSSRQSGKKRLAQSPLLAAASDSNLRLESALPPPATSKQEEALSANNGGKLAQQGASEAKLTVPAPSFFPAAAAKAAQAVNPLPQALTKAEAYAFFTTKYPNGTHMASNVQTQRQMVAVKEKTALSLAAAINLWMEEMEIESSKLASLVSTRCRTSTKSSAEIPIVTFDEYKLRCSLQHLQYLIETGKADLKLCRADLETLHHQLAESRKKLLAVFDEWFVRSCVEESKEVKKENLLVGPPLGTASATAPSTAITRPVTRPSLNAALAVSAKDEAPPPNGLLGSPRTDKATVPIAFKAALTPAKSKRKLDPPLTLRKMTTDLPTALRHPHL